MMTKRIEAQNVHWQRKKMCQLEKYKRLKAKIQSKQQSMFKKKNFCYYSILTILHQLWIKHYIGANYRWKNYLPSIYHIKINIQKKYTKEKENIETMKNIQEVIHDLQELSRWEKAKTKTLMTSSSATSI